MFNGHGEFWFLRVEDMEQYDNFNLQGRLITPPKRSGESINATMLASIAMQEGITQDQEIPKVEIQINNNDAKTKLLVLVNGALQDFSTTGLMYQEFYSNNMKRRIIIQNNDPITDNQQSNITVVFENGIAVQVANRDGFLHAIVIVPHKYYEKTAGLFGLWNDNPADDLRTSDGQLIDTNSSTEYLHSNFGQTWEIFSTDSRFTYRGKADWEYFSDKDFVPNFEEPEGSQGNITEEEVDNLCGENPVCRFDYKTTMSKDVANSSVHYQLWTVEVQKASASAISCPYPEVPRSYRTVDTYLVGGELTFTGCFEGYTLQGNKHYECTQINEHEAMWSPYVNAECKSNEEIEKERTQLLVAVLVPICLIIVFAVIATGGFIYYRKKHTPSTNKEPPSGFSTGHTRNDQFESMAEKASRSQSLASSNVSFGSVVLTEQILTARPPRPQSQKMNRESEDTNGQNPHSRANPHGSRPSSRQGSQLDLRLQPVPMTGESGPYANQSYQGMGNTSRNSNVLTGTGIPGYQPPTQNGSRQDLRGIQGSNLSLSSRNQGQVNASFQNEPGLNRSFGSRSNIPNISAAPGIVNQGMSEDQEPAINAVTYTSADV